MVGIPVSFSPGTFPLLLFQGVCPVHNFLSLMIAHWRIALILGLSSGLAMGMMGLVLAGGAPLPPLALSLDLCGVVAHSYRLL